MSGRAPEPRLAAVVLAAGSSRRFGANKLLELFQGEPLVVHAIRAACAAPVERIVVVKQPNAEVTRHCRAIADADPRVELIALESAFLSESLRAGLQAVTDADGVFVFLGDMPLTPPHLAARLADKLGDRFAAVPTCQGRPGHPVLLSARAAALAQHLSGDQGAGALLRRLASDVAHFETHDDRVIFDVDTREDYERLGVRGRLE